MAWYKYKEFLHYADKPEYDMLHKPGRSTPHSGIYRCDGCGHEIVSETGRVFPPQNHHQHAESQGEILWRLVAYADHEPK
ncbi:MAG: hypothetical protein ACHQAY_26705 [Hyphomicrobiales bacterium]